MAEEEIFKEALKLAELLGKPKTDEVPTGKLIDFEVSPPQADTRPETAVPVDSEQTPQSSCSTDSDMEQHRMEPVQEAEPLLASPTLPDTSGDSDSLVTSQKFDFDILLSPPETGNATFVKTPPFVGEEEDEVFFGPVKFSEIVARRAAAEQLEQTKPLASLTEEEMMEVMKESMRMVELLQQGLPRPADSKESPMQDNAVNSATVVKPCPSMKLAEEELKPCQTRLFSPSSSPGHPTTGDIPAGPHTSSPCEEKSLPKPAASAGPRTNQPMKRKIGLKAPSVTSGLKPPGSRIQAPVPAKKPKLELNHTFEKAEDSPDADVDTHGTQDLQDLDVSAISVDSAASTPSTEVASSSQPRRSLQPPSKFGKRKSTDSLQSSMNSSALSSTSEPDSKQVSTASSSSTASSTGLPRPGKVAVQRRSLQLPGSFKTEAVARSKSSDRLQTRLNTSSRSDTSEGAAPPRGLRPPSKVGVKKDASETSTNNLLNSSSNSQPSEEASAKRRSLPQPSKIASSLKPPGSTGQSGLVRPAVRSGLVPPSVNTTSKSADTKSSNAIKSNIPAKSTVGSRLNTAQSKLNTSRSLNSTMNKSQLESSINKPAIKSSLTKLDKLKPSLGAGAATSRLVRPGALRPAGPMKAVQPVVPGASGLRAPAIRAPVAAAGSTSPGSSTPKRGAQRSNSFGGQTPTRRNSETGGNGPSTPGSAKRKSMLPTVPLRASHSSVGSMGSLSSLESPGILGDIQNIADASPSCFSTKSARIQRTPVNKENATSKVSRWSPVPRPKPINGDEYFVCTKKTAK